MLEAENGLLYLVIQEFCTAKAYLGADKISSVDMGYIFEELVRKFSESYDEQAGAHFTARDIINLMAALILSMIYPAFGIYLNVCLSRYSKRKKEV